MAESIRDSEASLCQGLNGNELVGNRSSLNHGFNDGVIFYVRCFDHEILPIWSKPYFRFALIVFTSAGVLKGVDYAQRSVELLKTSKLERVALDSVAIDNLD